MDFNLPESIYDMISNFSLIQLCGFPFVEVCVIWLLKKCIDIIRNKIMNRNPHTNKTVKQIVLPPIKEEPYKKGVIFVFDYIAVGLQITLIWLLLALYCSLCAKFFEISNASFLILILASFIVLIIASFIKKYSNKEKIYILKALLRIIIISTILFCFIIITNGNNVKLAMFILGTIFVYGLIETEVVLNKLGYYKRYVYAIVKITKTLRYILVVTNILIAFIVTLNEFMTTISSVVCIIWLFLGVFEDAFINIKSSSAIEVRIETIDGEKITTSAIYELENNKISYTLSNNIMEVVEGENVNYFSYKLKYFKKKKKDSDNFVECVLKNGKRLEFLDFHFKDASWIYFYSINKGIKEVCIINSNKVKKIVWKKRYVE